MVAAVLHLDERAGMVGEAAARCGAVSRTA